MQTSDRYSFTSAFQHSTRKQAHSSIIHTHMVSSFLSPSHPFPHPSPHSDKSVIVWELERGADSFGYPKKALRGHSHFVQDVVISSDGQFCLSGSWDGTLRLWDLNTVSVCGGVEKHRGGMRANAQHY